jgi:hypothetical protein
VNRILTKVRTFIDNIRFKSDPFSSLPNSGASLSPDMMFRKAVMVPLRKERPSLWKSFKETLQRWACKLSKGEYRIDNWSVFWTSAYLLGSSILIYVAGSVYTNWEAFLAWGKADDPASIPIILILLCAALLCAPGIFVWQTLSRYRRDRWNYFFKWLALKRQLTVMPAEKKSEAIATRYQNTLQRYKEEVTGQSRPFGMVFARTSDLLRRAREEHTYWQTQLAAFDAGTKSQHPFASREQYVSNRERAQRLMGRLEPVHANLSEFKGRLTAYFDQELAKIPPIRSALSDYFHADELQQLEHEVDEVESASRTVGMNILQGFHQEVYALQSEAQQLAMLSDKAIAGDGVDMPALEELATKLLKSQKETESRLDAVITATS